MPCPPILASPRDLPDPKPGPYSHCGQTPRAAGDLAPSTQGDPGTGDPALLGGWSPHGLDWAGVWYLPAGGGPHSGLPNGYPAGAPDVPAKAQPASGRPAAPPPSYHHSYRSSTRRVAGLPVPLRAETGGPVGTGAGPVSGAAEAGGAAQCRGSGAETG